MRPKKPKPKPDPSNPTAATVAANSAASLAAQPWNSTFNSPIVAARSTPSSVVDKPVMATTATALASTATLNPPSAIRLDASSAPVSKVVQVHRGSAEKLGLSSSAAGALVASKWDQAENLKEERVAGSRLALAASSLALSSCNGISTNTGTSTNSSTGTNTGTSTNTGISTNTSTSTKSSTVNHIGIGTGTSTHANHALASTSPTAPVRRHAHTSTASPSGVNVKVEVVVDLPSTSSSTPNPSLSKPRSRTSTPSTPLVTTVKKPALDLPEATSGARARGTPQRLFQPIATHAIDPSSPFGTTKWNSHKRVARGDETVCTWRLTEKSIFTEAKRCNRRLVTAELLAKHILREHIGATPTSSRETAEGTNGSRSGLAHRAQGQARGPTGEEVDDDPLDVLPPLSGAEARQTCRWGNCSNRRYLVAELGTHVLNHLEFQCGLKHSCPFKVCPSNALINSETALQNHLENYHRDDYWLSDLRPVFGTVKVDRATLQPPPPLPGAGSVEARRMMDPVSLCLGPDALVVSTVSRASLAHVVVPPPPVEEAWPLVQHRHSILGLPLQPEEDDYLSPWNKMMPKYLYHEERERLRREADEGIGRGFEVDAFDPRLRGQPFEIVDVERAETRAVDDAIAQGRFATDADLARVGRSGFELELPSTRGLRETLGVASLRALVEEEDEERRKERLVTLQRSRGAPSLAVAAAAAAATAVVPGIKPVQMKEATGSVVPRIKLEDGDDAMSGVSYVSLNAAGQPPTQTEEDRAAEPELELALPGLGRRLILPRHRHPAGTEEDVPKREDVVFIDLDLGDGRPGNEGRTDPCGSDANDAARSTSPASVESVRTPPLPSALPPLRLPSRPPASSTPALLDPPSHPAVPLKRKVSSEVATRASPPAYPVKVEVKRPKVQPDILGENASGPAGTARMEGNPSCGARESPQQPQPQPQPQQAKPTSLDRWFCRI